MRADCSRTEGDADVGRTCTGFLRLMYDGTDLDEWRNEPLVVDG
jgi:hypothetical protein